MGFLSKLFRKAGDINDYFADAVWVFQRTDDPIARLAALTAAKVAAGMQRASMIQYLRATAEVERQSGNGEVGQRADQLADEIALHDWGLADIIEAKRALWGVDTQYGQALDKFDSGIFRRRFPDLFLVDRR